MKDFIDRLGFPRLIMSIFLICLIILAVNVGLSLPRLISDILVRFGMNAILVLAMVPAVQSGIGVNFNLPLGIVFGLIGALISIELRLTGLTAFFVAVLISIPMAAVAGYFYGHMLNRIKGQEMTVGTYMGFSIVSLMCIFWLILPFKNPALVWAYGGTGLRVTISLENSMQHVLNNLLEFKIGNIVVPTGLLLFFALCAFIVWVFTRSKQGLSMRVAGYSEKFALSNGIDVDRERIIGTMISTVLAAVGIIVYSQSLGILQLYTAPLYAAMPAVAAVLIGGASLRKANISHVVIGTFLFQAILVVSLPVINLIAESGMSEVVRAIVSNGIILYALTRGGGEGA